MVHFSAYWCVPSIAMDPFFEELASTYQDVLFLKVDVDEVKVFFIVYGGEGLPFSFVFFKNYLFHIPLSMQHRHLKLKVCLVSEMFLVGLLKTTQNQRTKISVCGLIVTVRFSVKVILIRFRTKEMVH